MAIRFRCHGCKQLLSISDRKAGQVVRCPACSTELQIPSLEEVTEEPVETPTPPPEEPADVAGDELPADAASSPVAEVQPVTESVAQPADVSQQPPSRHDEDEDDGFVMRAAETEFEDMDLTPMVDVTFLLLIFFMITASFSLQKAIQVPAPDPDEEGRTQNITIADLEEDSIIVEIDENNAIFIDDDLLSDPSSLVETLRDKMNSERKGELVIDAHEAAFHETVILVIDAANEIQIQRIRLVSRSGG